MAALKAQAKTATPATKTARVKLKLVPARDKSELHPPKKEPALVWAGRVPLVKPGTFADGMPFHDINYLSFKLMLKPNRLTSRRDMFEFGKRVVRPCAAEQGVGFSMAGFKRDPVQVREVLFIDTADYRLYKNAFILRRRISYEDGFPVGDPEIVFKFRHTDIQKAAEMDVRPNIVGSHRVKFKCQALPLKDRLGGMRLLFSHNVQFPRAHVAEQGVLAQHGIAEHKLLTMGTMTKFFPVLQSLKKDPDEKIELVSGMVIEEVLQDIGTLDFGEGLTADCDVGLWRARGEHRPLIGEFAYQIKFADRRELAIEAMRKAEAFFYGLQRAAIDWIALNATKTGVVYRQDGNAPKSHE